MLLKYLYVLYYTTYPQRSIQIYIQFAVLSTMFDRICPTCHSIPCRSPSANEMKDSLPLFSRDWFTEREKTLDKEGKTLEKEAEQFPL